MIYIVMSVILGLCLGSYFNVVVIRGLEDSREHCHGKRSECMTCGHTLSPLDLVPVFSWLFLGGKCRYCKEKISWIYPVGEALTAIGFTVVGLQIKDLMYVALGNWKPEYINSLLSIIVMLVTVISLSICTISDLKEKIIYSIYAYGAIFIIVVLRSIQCYEEYKLSVMLFNYGIWVGRVLMFIGLIILFSALSKILHNKIGGGDFDIFLLLYVAGGVNCMFNSIFIGSAVGCSLVLVLILLKKFSKGTAIPMVPLLYIGYLLQVYISALHINF